jgi:hypothetical protein
LNAVLTELSFRVASRDNLLCAFTQVHEDATIVINPFRASASADIERAMYTIHTGAEEARDLVEGHFEEEYGEYEVLAERDDCLTVEVPFRLPSVGPRGDPLHMALEALGNDAFFLPLVVEDGFIHCTLVSSSPQGTRGFIELTKSVTKHLDPETFDLLNVGPWNPAPEADKRDELTSRQEDVLQMAIALGYYNQPRETTLEELGEVLDVSKAAVHKTLTAAENKVLKDAMGSV